jgi:hypothetical protein
MMRMRSDGRHRQKRRPRHFRAPTFDYLSGRQAID